MEIKGTLRAWAARCHVSCYADFCVLGFCVDSRSVKPGDLFFALPGARVDGHLFLEEAAKKGAAGAIVRSDYRGSSYGLPLIHVEDVLEMLQQLAREALQEAGPMTVAITGSVGKTTTKEWVYQLLQSGPDVVRSPGSCNSQIGLPLSILQLFGMPSSTGTFPKTFVAEMGMTEPGQIKKLISIAPPDYALLTAVSLVQAHHFSGEEAIAAEKGSIFSSSRTAIGVLPSQITAVEKVKMIGSCLKRTFSLTDPSADYRLKQRQEAGIHTYTLETPKGSFPLGTWHLPGKHALHNLLAACAISCECGLDPHHIPKVVPQLQFPQGRMQYVKRGGVMFVDDSYNAPPIGVEMALSSLPEPGQGGRRIAVLGTMPELGAFSEQLHEKIARHALDHVDVLFCIGEETLAMHAIWKEAKRPSRHFISKKELSHHLHSFIQPGDVVLVKGMNRLQMWTLLDKEK